MGTKISGNGPVIETSATSEGRNGAVSEFWQRLGIGSAGFAVLAAAIAASPVGAPRIMAKNDVAAAPENAGIAVAASVADADLTPETAALTIETEAPALQPVEFEHPRPDACRSEIDRALAGRKIFYERNSDRLSQSDRDILTALLGALAECSGLTLIIEGHTDSSGSEQANLRISEKRARAVADFLKEGAPEVRLIERAYGESRPIASNASAAGRMANRRIEFVVEGADGESE